MSCSFPWQRSGLGVPWRRMTSAGPVLSALIPTWNRRASVTQAIESVLAQEGVALEVLVVDDGSTDGTSEHLAERFGSDPRVRVHRQANGGTARARNAGLELVRTPLVGLLDSDDRWLPGFAATHVRALEANPGVALSLSDARYVTSAGAALGSYGLRVHGHPPGSLADMLAGGWGLPSCMVFRSDVLRGLRFDPAWGIEDTELLFRFFAAGHRRVWTPALLTDYTAADPLEGAPRKGASDVSAKWEQLRLMEIYATHAPDPRAHAVRLARRRSLLYARAGQFRAARPHAREWWRRRPLQLRAPWILLRSLVSSR